MNPGLSIYCPVCDGKVGEACVTRSGKPTRNHVERVKAETKVRTNLDAAVAPPPTESTDLDAWINRIHQGDALELMGQMPDECVDLVVTSPPYNLHNSTGGGAKNSGCSGVWHGGRYPALSQGYGAYSDDMPRDKYVAWQRDCLTEMLRLLKPTGAIFYNHRPRMQGLLEESPRDIVEGFPLRQAIIWAKSGGINHTAYALTPTHEVVYLLVKNPTETGFRRREGSQDHGTVWSIPRDRNSDHPAPFPVDLARRCIQMSNAAVVLDPFSGSGTTAVAAVLESRDYIGIDLNAEYCEVSRRRVASVTPSPGKVHPVSHPVIPSPDNANPVSHPVIPSPDNANPVSHPVIPSPDNANPVSHPVIPSPDNANPVSHPVIPSSRHPVIPSSDSVIPSSRHPVTRQRQSRQLVDPALRPGRTRAGRLRPHPGHDRPQRREPHVQHRAAHRDGNGSWPEHGRTRTEGAAPAWPHHRHQPGEVRPLLPAGRAFSRWAGSDHDVAPPSVR